VPSREPTAKVAPGASAPPTTTRAVARTRGAPPGQGVVLGELDGDLVSRTGGEALGLVELGQLGELCLLLGDERLLAVGLAGDRDHAIFPV
jgi:hypothetical protein